MKNKIFLSSMLIMSVAPAMAENFPSNGLMQQNKTYDNAATSTNMDGVYEGTVNATAEYETINYLLNAGKYLPKDSETITTCPAGSFCAGGETVQYNENLAQGIETCPSGFGSSADGSSSNTQCYRACDINNVGDSITAIAHATAISGNDYYGNGTDTCEPTACENGWHLKPGAPDLINIIGNTEVKKVGSTIYNAAIRNNGEKVRQANVWGMTEKNTWAVDYGDKGRIAGHGRCSTSQGFMDGDFDGYNWSNPTVYETLVDETGNTGAQYCYCKLDSYTPSGESLISVSTPWVYTQNPGSASSCAEDCAVICADNLAFTYSSDLRFRAAFFGFVGNPLASCEANTITINWSNADAEDVSANNAGTATYGSDVRTPVKAQTIKGKTFKGWRFSAPEQTTTSGNNG